MALHSIVESSIDIAGNTCNWAVSSFNDQPLLMLHGVTRRWQSFLPIFAGLAERWKIHALDFRGHGRSSHVAGSYRVVDYINDVSAVLRDQFHAPVAIYGHSLGAMVALGAAAQVPERVKAILLEDPPFHTMGARLHESPLMGYFRTMQGIAQLKRPLIDTARALADIVLTDPKTKAATRLGDFRDPAVLRFMASCLSQLDPEVLTTIASGTWLEGYDLEAIAKRVRCPTLLLQADLAAGGMLVDDDAELLHRLLSDCTRVRLTGASHLMHSQRPAEIVGVVHNFLESLES